MSKKSKGLVDCLEAGCRSRSILRIHILS